MNKAWINVLAFGTVQADDGIRVDYGLQTVTLKHFLTHEQYDRDKWKKDC